MEVVYSGWLSANDAALDQDLRDLQIVSGADGSYLYAATGQNGGISTYHLPVNGAPQLVDSLYHSASGLGLGSFSLGQMGGGMQLILTGGAPGQLLSYDLNPDGGLSALQQNGLPGGSAQSLSAGLVVPLANGQGAFYGIGSGSGAQLQGWQVSAAGQVQGAVSTAGSNADYSLSGAGGLTQVTVGGQQILLAADDQGLHSYLVNGQTGALSAGDSFGVADGLGLAVPTALHSVQAYGASWVVMGAAGSSSISVFQVSATGSLQPATHLIDSLATRFGGLSALEVVTAGAHVLVLAAGADDGLSLFVMLPGGQLVHLQSLEHEAGLGLQDVTALEAAVVGDSLQVFVSSEGAAGISQFSLPLDQLGEMSQGSGLLRGGSRDDVLVGQGSGDTLQGRGGDDVLMAGPGGGVLSGGAGRDIFVLGPSSGVLQISDFQPGQDQIDMSYFTGLRSPAQLSYEPLPGGLQIRHGDTVIEVYSASGADLTPAQLWPAGFVFPDRVPPVPLPDWAAFYGTAGADVLRGGDGVDKIWGLAGKDQISGLDGDDRLHGGTGGDQIQGGRGKDRLWGDKGADDLRGGNDSDQLYGGAGEDSLRGEDGRDTLKGGGGADQLWGNAGDDILKGGKGQDRLLGGKGADDLTGNGNRDVLKGGKGRDSLFGGGGGDTLRGGDGKDQLSGGGGADTFVFGTSHGKDVVADFTPGKDYLDLGLIASRMRDLQLSAQGDDTLIDTGQGLIRLQGVAPGELSADDFLF